ncbi:hypothetical protein KDD17_11760 [Sulfitobacter albidus]|uniref:Uncharacterized protein n=1 Tax=Sulfitobacter albidus TaxID=2829501 RepID=A0A975JCM4_9RHOB|nr:hypothetical protein [Sulfitobacter albidus]QUJ75630.1 hypothetical protein KDD17_11760 [Sulfitobacter albidus]
MTQSATIPFDSGESILSLSESDIATFISEHRFAKTLGTVVGHLNYGLLFGSPEQQSMARRALEKLGFTDV